MASDDMRVLVSDPIAQEGLAVLQAASGLTVTVNTDQTPNQLLAAVKDCDALVVRSQTQVTAAVIAAAPRLKVIARAGVGVDNIDVKAATQRGVVVINSPEGNTMAAAEHTIALLLALSRNLPAATASLHRGEWKRSQFVGVEVYQKTLGVVGLGKIGTEVVRRAQALGMKVLGYDPFITREHAERLGVEIMELAEMLPRCDYLTLHVPLNKDTRGMIGAAQLAAAKDKLRIINVARGGLIDELALAQAIQAGKVAGAAIDVFEQEPPPPDHPLLKLEQVLATPHLGASTEEAQIKVAVDVCEQVVAVLSGGQARTAVNVTPVRPEMLGRLEPYLLLAEKMGCFISGVAPGRPVEVEAIYSGEVAELETGAITRALLKGLLSRAMEESVNMVNAMVVAEQRGLSVKESRSRAPEDYNDLVTVRLRTESGSVELAGTLFGKRDIRIVRLDEYRVDVVPEGYLLIAPHTDMPGVIGKVGTILGSNDVNIAGMQVGRRTARGQAVMILALDDPVPPAALQQIRNIAGITSATLVEL